MEETQNAATIMTMICSRRLLLLNVWAALLTEGRLLVEGFVNLPSFGGSFTKAPLLRTCASALDHRNGNVHDGEDNGDRKSEEGDRISKRNIPTNPFDLSGRPSKSDLYGDDELLNLLNVHSQLTGNTGGALSETNLGTESLTSNPLVYDTPPSSIDSENSMPGIHESIMRSYGEDTMQRLLSLHDSLDEVRQSKDSQPSPDLHEQILQAVGEIQQEQKTLATPSPRSFDWLNGATKDTIQNSISAIASDVDGTLLTSRQTMHPRTRKALIRAIEQAPSEESKIKHFFPATGKSRKGAFQSLGTEIAELLENAPGVFLQGLYCLDAEGNVLFERKLETSALGAAVALAKEHDISIVAYDGDDLYTTEMTDIVVDLTNRYGEPRPSCLTSLVGHKPGMHKLLYLDENVKRLNEDIRPKLEALAASNGASVTQAIPTMLELLPQGCSKDLGVRYVCEALNIDPSTQLLAIGDAENDAGMLDMAAIGVAVGNASPAAMKASDFVLEDTNDDGGAGVAMEVFGFGDGFQ